MNAAFGDADFQCATQRSANWLSDANMPTFIYYFAYELPVVRLFDPTIGVCHASELLFVFDLESYDGIPLPVRKKLLLLLLFLSISMKNISGCRKV